MKFNRVVLVVVSLALMLLALAGCGKDAAQDSQKKLNVVATTTMLTDLVKEIGGDHVSVQGLMGPGVDPHLYQASAGDVTTMSKADVVVYNGIHLEGKMGSIFDNLTKQNKATIRVSDAIDPATLLDFDEEDGVKTKDPHIWFDVANWKLAAKAVYEGLAKADPAHKEDFKKRYDAYLTKLDETDAYVTAQDNQKKLNVVATTTMLTDLVKEIGGDHVSVQGLMGPGVDPHLYQASAGDVTAMSKADVVVYNGVHLEGKMGSIFDNLTKQNKATIRVSDAIDPSTLLDFDEEDGVKTKDPHIWFDVANWKLAAKAVYEGLSKADPAHKEDFKKRYDAYLTKLDETDSYIKAQAESIPEESRVLVTAHDAFQYFARAYGFEVKGLQGVSTATEAGTQDVNELVQFIVDHKIKAIFVESSVPHKTIEAVQEAAKAQGWNVAIGGELYSDSLGSEGTEGGTYIGMVKANIDTIVKALK